VDLSLVVLGLVNSVEEGTGLAVLGAVGEDEGQLHLSVELAAFLVEVDSHEGGQDASLQQVFQVLVVHVDVHLGVEDDLSHDFLIRVADDHIEG
jgi:hypothetical protein